MSEYESKSVFQEKKPYTPPLIVVEFELETSAGNTLIGGSIGYEENSVNPWSLP